MKWFGKHRKKEHVFVLQNTDELGIVSPSEKGYVDTFWDNGKDQRNRDALQLTISTKRFRIGAIGLLIAFFLFGGRAAQLQIVEGSHYQSLAEGNRVRSFRINAPRGIIYDRNGEILVENTPAFVLEMIPGDIPIDESERNALFEEVSDLAGINRTDLDLLYSKYASSPHQQVPVKKAIPFETAIRLSIEAVNLPGFDMKSSSRRSYITSIPSLSHVLGYTGKISESEYRDLQEEGYKSVDELGKTGIEKSEEAVLRGIPGERTVEVDARGRELAVISKTDAIAGGNITLTIDAELQKFIEARLQNTFSKTDATKASVVVIDPKTGAIRSLVSLPTYDSNAFATGIDPDLYSLLIEDPDKPLFNRAVSGEFASGSVFKPFVAYAALKEGIISANTSFLSAGGIGVSVWFFPDWKYGGHGITNVRKAIAESVNTFFYIIGGGYEGTTGLGVKRITDYAAKFGFGDRTGINLPSEADGFLPSKDWKVETKGERWYVGDTYHLAIGQGDLLVTPLQIALGTAIIANGGNQLTPYLVEGVDGFIPIHWQAQQTIEREELDREMIQIVREGMRQTVTRGSARSLSALPLDAAGKTGTAQTPGDKETHAWFSGFAPYNNPEIAVAVLIEHGGEGSSVASPVAKDIFEWWHYNGR